MSAFKDSAGREWTITVNVPTIRAVRAALNVDIGNWDTISELEADTVLLVDTLWILCKSQADKIGVNDLQFAECLAGDVIDDATKALIEAVANFSPSRRRSLLLSASSKMQDARMTAETLALEKLADPMLTDRLAAALKTRLETEMEVALTRLSSPSSLPAKLE